MNTIWYNLRHWYERKIMNLRGTVLSRKSSGPLQPLTLVYGGSGEQVPFCLWKGFAPARGEASLFVLTAVSLPCCVNVQIKHIIMTESRYDKYGECQGSFIIMTAEIVSGSWDRQNTLVYWKGLLKCVCHDYGVHILICFLFFQEVLKKVVAVSEEFPLLKGQGDLLELLCFLAYDLLSCQSNKAAL